MYRGEEKCVQDFWWIKLNEWQTNKLKAMDFVDVPIQALLNHTLGRGLSIPREKSPR